MRFKVDPEVVRFVTAITAGVQGVTAVLTGTDVVSPTVLVIVVAVGAFLQGWGAAYSQGVQTSPPPGMLTEERAAELQERDMGTPDTEQPAQFETGRAVIPAVPAGSDRFA